MITDITTTKPKMQLTRLLEINLLIENGAIGWCAVIMASISPPFISPRPLSIMEINGTFSLEVAKQSGTVSIMGVYSKSGYAWE